MRFFVGTPVVASSSANLAATASSGGGANAVVSLAAPASSGGQRVLSEALWSYSTTPAPGGIKVFDGTSSGAVLLDLDITAAGVDGIVFAPLTGTPGNAVTVELLQAGSSITGKLAAYGRLL